MSNDKNKKIEIIKGNGKLDISPVHEHLDVEKPKKKTNKNNIIIPQEKKQKK